MSSQQKWKKNIFYLQKLGQVVDLPLIYKAYPGTPALLFPPLQGHVSVCQPASFLKQHKQTD